MNKTYQDLIEFINKQPDERPINMRESASSHDCGCLLVQYGRDELKLPGVWGCGYTHILAQEHIEFDRQTLSFIKQLLHLSPTNYKQIKDFIKSR